MSKNETRQHVSELFDWPEIRIVRSEHLQPRTALVSPDLYVHIVEKWQRVDAQEKPAAPATDKSKPA